MADSASAGAISGTVTFIGKARKNAAIHLEGIKKEVAPPHKHDVIVQKGQRNIPQVLPVVKGTKVDFPNKDTVFHNAFSLTTGNTFDFGTYGPGGNPHTQFNAPGKTDIICNMHEQMHGLVLVLEHPYFSLTSKKGTFEINEVPAGTYTIKAWITPTKWEEKTVQVDARGSVRVDFDVAD